MTLEPKAGLERTMAQKTTMAPEATAPGQQCQNSSARIAAPKQQRRQVFTWRRGSGV
jgi:hypothetical protein